MNDIAISIKNVSKYYKLYNSPKDRLKEALNFRGKQYHKKFYATRNLDLEIKKGEILGVVGKNGSGKSTLLKLITGVLTPNEGSIQVNGKISALLELGSGFNPEFTGMQNIFFYGTILGFTKQEMEEKLDDILAFADIGEFIDQPLKTYSSGMKSRLGFAVAVHIDPEILILDEVLAVGDVLFKRKCYAKMEEFFKGGKTIIYVSHDAGSVKELCTRAIFLDSGNILMDSDPNTVTKYYQKYIFADVNKQIEIKNEISRFVQEEKSQKKIVNHEDTSNRPYDEHYHIENFIPQDTIEYKNHDIDIIDPKIVTEEGESVNVLLYGKKYKYVVTYRSNETRSFENIAFGMDFHTDKGIIVAGVESVFSYKYGVFRTLLKPKESCTVAFEFICLLPAGNYFVNTGISSFKDNEQQILNRKVDLFCFKVQEVEKRINSGQSYVFDRITVNKNTVLWQNTMELTYTQKGSLL